MTSSSSTSPLLTRRRALRTLFCSSAALSLNLRPVSAAEAAGAAAGAAATSGEGLDLLAIGDFGTSGAQQRKVAATMQKFVTDKGLKPHGMLMIGDNFYGPTKGGFTPECARWQTGIEQMYPAAAFPGPMWAVLGNHDYHDNAGGELVQLAYAKREGLRWQMPAKWYRHDFGSVAKPLVTMLCLDTNLPAVSGTKDKKTGKPRASLTPAEAAAQLAWLKAELAKPRAPFTLVMAHHPLYSNGDHGDTKPLIQAWGELLQQHKVHAFLCGHDHDLQHLELEGKFTSFVLSGGGGAKTRDLKVHHKVPFSQKAYGFTHIRMEPEALSFSHYDEAGTRVHSFTKRPDGQVLLG